MSRITISTIDILGHALACDVLFSPKSTPRVEGQALILSAPRSVTLDAQGHGEIDLEAGYYDVRFVGSKSHKDTVSIGVPDDNATYPMVMLIDGGITIPMPPSMQGPPVPLSDATPSAPGVAAPGTSETASRDDHVHSPPSVWQVTGLQAVLDTEHAARIAAESALQSAINAEATTRQTAVADEAAARATADSTLHNEVSAEASARVAADATLQSAISAEAASRQSAVADEAAARASADTSLQSGLIAEAAARASADAALQSAITAEATARQTAVADEAAARAAADSTLHNEVTAEAVARAAADAALQTSIDTKQPSGSYATLDGSGKVPAAQLPSYVDDVLEYGHTAFFPSTGETGKIYVDLSTGKIHRWSGTVYVEVSASPGSTDSVTEGLINLYFTAARSAAAAPVQSVSGRTGNVTLSKSDVGLDKVQNTTDLEKPVSTAQQAAIDAEATARQSADTALQNGINTEASTRASADTTLQNAITAEAAARAAADAALQTSIDGKQPSGSYATLDGGGKVPAAQLPSYVDDVLEYTNAAAFPATGETGKIYVDLSTSKIHRWTGSAYVEISPSPGSTDAVPEGSTNLYFTAGRVLATVLSGLSTATNAVITAGDSVLSAFGKLQRQISDHFSNTSNPHSTTKAQVGLGNCDNTSDLSKPISTAVQSALDLKAARRDYRTSSFSATAYGRYLTAGTITVTDPGSASVGDMFDVLIVSGTAVIGGVTYSASRFPVERYYNGSAWVTPQAAIAENLSLAGSNNTASNQVGVTPASGTLMVRDQVDFQRVIFAPFSRPYITGVDYFTAGTGSAAYTSSSFDARLAITGSDAAAVAACKIVGAIYPHWGRKMYWQFQLSHSGTASASALCRKRCTVGQTNSGTDLTLAAKGVGCYFDSETTVKIQVHNGSTLTESGSLTVPSQFLPNTNGLGGYFHENITLLFTPGVSLALYLSIQGVLTYVGALTTGLPTPSSGNDNSARVGLYSNGGTANDLVYVHNFVSGFLP